MARRIDRMVRALALACLVLVCVFTFAGDAMAQESASLPQRTSLFKMEKNEKGQRFLKVGFTARGFVDGNVMKKLGSGVTVVIATRAYVFVDGQSDPIALGVRTCHVAYDLLDELYRVKLLANGVQRDLAAQKVDTVIRLCVDTVQKDVNGADQPTMVVADQSLLASGKPHFVGVIMEVNPLSQEQLEQMRRYITRPAGSTGIGPGDALFGSFVNFFVRQIGTADKTERFRTQSVTP